MNRKEIRPQRSSLSSHWGKNDNDNHQQQPIIRSRLVLACIMVVVYLFGLESGSMIIFNESAPRPCKMEEQQQQQQATSLPLDTMKINNYDDNKAIDKINSIDNNHNENIINTINKIHIHTNVTSGTPVLAETILWSQNWKRYAMGCPSLPAEYFMAKTSTKHTGPKLREWMAECHGVYWIRMGSGRIEGGKRPKNNVGRFARHVVGDIQKPFILITTDGDASIPSYVADYKNILNNPNCLAWYTQNYDGTDQHPKLRPIPIGFDLHTNWKGSFNPPGLLLHDTVRQMMQLRRTGLARLRNASHIFIPKWSERRRGKRRDRAAFNYVADGCNIPHKHGPKVPIHLLWDNYTQYRFGPSPKGNGLDSHRTWEYLFFGMVPIVKTTSLDPLYEGLPVIIVHNWVQLCNREFLQKEWEVNISKVWPAPDEVFTMKWWLQKNVDPVKDSALYDLLSRLPF